MGLLGNWFASAHSSGRAKKISFKDKSKLNRRDVHDLVWSISSLDTKEKKLVEDELLKELSGGGVEKWEYKEVIRQLSLKRVEFGLSEVDISNLRKVLY